MYVRHAPTPGTAGFTLIEILVAMTVASLVLILIAQTQWLGAHSLVLDRGVARVKRVRGDLVGAISAAQRVDVTLDAQGNGTINGLIQFFGALAGNIREALSDPRRGPQIKESVVRQAWRLRDVENPDVHQLRELRPDDLDASVPVSPR